MKWVAIIIVLAVTVPFSAWLRRNPWAIPKVLMLMGFLPFVIYNFHLYMAAISWTEWPSYVKGVGIFLTAWPGYVKGIEISALDLLALTLYLSLPGVRRPLPFRASMALYFFAVSLSTFSAEVPIAALFYLWQLARMFLVYAVVARACADPRATYALLKGMAAGLFMETGVVIWQRFGLEMIQPHGTVTHQNLLGIMSHFVVLPFFALLLVGRGGWLPAAVTLAGIPVEVLTASRGTVAVAALGYAVVFILSILRRWTSRKALLLLIGGLTVMAAMPLVIWSFGSRFTTGGIDTSLVERAAFETAAAMILSDHPFGVGANQYALAANVGDYNLRVVGIPTNPNDLLGNVHNVYWLVAAETGYIGIITFLLLLLRPLTVAFLCSWRNQGDPRGDLLMGLAVALFAVYIHSRWEWVSIDYEVQYMFVLTVGLVAGLAEQLGYWRRRRPQGVRLRVGILPIRSMKNTGGLSRRIGI